MDFEMGRSLPFGRASKIFVDWSAHGEFWRTVWHGQQGNLCNCGNKSLAPQTRRSSAIRPLFGSNGTRPQRILRSSQHILILYRSICPQVHPTPNNSTKRRRTRTTKRDGRTTEVVPTSGRSKQRRNSCRSRDSQNTSSGSKQIWNINMAADPPMPNVVSSVPGRASVVSNPFCALSSACRCVLACELWHLSPLPYAGNAQHSWIR